MRQKGNPNRGARQRAALRHCLEIWTWKSSARRSGGVEIRRKQALPRHVLQVRFAGVVVEDVLHRLADEVKSQYGARVQMIEDSEVGGTVHEFRVLPRGGLHLAARLVELMDRR